MCMTAKLFIQTGDQLSRHSSARLQQIIYIKPHVSSATYRHDSDNDKYNKRILLKIQ